MYVKDKVTASGVDNKHSLAHDGPTDEFKQDYIDTYAVRAGFAYKVGIVHQIKYIHDLNRDRASGQAGDADD